MVLVASDLNSMPHSDPQFSHFLTSGHQTSYYHKGATYYVSFYIMHWKSQAQGPNVSPPALSIGPS